LRREAEDIYVREKWKKKEEGGKGWRRECVRRKKKSNCFKIFAINVYSIEFMHSLLLPLFLIFIFRFRLL